MKKISRILAIVMALALVLGMSTAHAAVPTDISQIENLPELPEYPTMKVKSAKGITTITLSAPLTWLNVIENWNWHDIITWNEDKTVGTYSYAGFKSAAGTGRYMGGGGDLWVTANPNGLVDDEGEDVEVCGTYLDGYNGDINSMVTGEDPAHCYEKVKIYVWDEATQSEKLTDRAQGTWTNGNGDGGGFWFYEQWKVYHPNEGFDKYYENKELVGDYPEYLVDVNHSVWCGWYDMGFAYDGGLQDGSDIKYTASGKVASITVTKTGENYLGSENAPVKSEVTFKWLYGRPYISEIKETFDDDSTITATFAFNGSRIKLH